MNNPKQLVQSSFSSYVNYFQKQMVDIWRPDDKKWLTFMLTMKTGSHLCVRKNGEVLLAERMSNKWSIFQPFDIIFHLKSHSAINL